MDRTKLSTASVPDGVREEYAQLVEPQQALVSDLAGFYERPFSADFDKYLTQLLSSLYGAGISRAMKFLFESADDGTRRRFANIYLSPATMATLATAKVVVCPAEAAGGGRSSKAHYDILLLTDDDKELPVKFPSRLATVYYLMYLIHRYNKGLDTPPSLLLASNKLKFAALFHTVYDGIPHSDVLSRYQSLLYQEGNGRWHAGRQSVVVSEIRRTLATVLKDSDQNFMPYIMTVNSQMAIQPEMIVFEDAAQRLLFFDFN